MSAIDAYPNDFGPCCACGKEDETVRNIVMLEVRASRPGTGWGCFVCGLPSDGALAIVCDSCLESRAYIADACDGYPTDKKRVPVKRLQGAFTHDLSKHPEETGS